MRGLALVTEGAIDDGMQCLDEAAVVASTADLAPFRSTRFAEGKPWSDARRYGATTRAATWGRFASGLAGQLPPGTRWVTGRTVPRPAAERFRDRWRKGLV
jgi:hypothetical protein